MLAYLFLGHGATSTFDGRRWPTPAGAPGEWVSGRVEAPDAARGCGPADLPYWIDDELWVVELDGVLRHDSHVTRASHGRLHRRVDAWDATAAAQMAFSCAARARDVAVDALRTAGLTGGADRLAAATDPAEIEEVAREIASSDSGTVSDLAGYVADALSCIRASATPGAGAAVSAYVSARAVACADASGDYATAIAAERARQASWLGERLGLPAAGPAGDPSPSAVSKT